MRTFLLILVIAFADSLYAQDQYTLLDENAVWVQVSDFDDGGFGFDTITYLEIRLNGDTLLANGLNKKVYLDDRYYGGLREEDKRVIYTTETEIDTILDFNLAIGDTVIIEVPFSGIGCAINMGDCQFMVLETIDAIQLQDGSIRKRLNFYGCNAGIFLLEDFEVSWIDGIGSTRGLLIARQCSVLPKTIHSPTCSGRLICYQNNGEVLFSNRKEPIFRCTTEGVLSDVTTVELEDIQITLSPNPTSDQLTVSFQTTAQFQAWSYRIFDQLGRIIAQQEIVHQSKFSIDVSLFDSGIYWLEILIDGKRIKRAIMIE